MEGKIQKIILSGLAILMCAGLSAQDRNGQRDSLVRLIKAKTLELIEKDGVNYRKTIEATFFHNNTYFICDTALWNVDSRIINADGHVRVVQDGTILTSDKMIYRIDDDLVQFRGTLVQLEDKDHNTLRTHNLDYNTKDSLAFFTRGGAMRDGSGQLIESTEGSYDAKASYFEFRQNVNMFTDSIFIRTAKIEYESGPSRVVFPEKIDFWKDDNMLSADRGWYKRLEETFFFNGMVHAMSAEQEGWSDSLYFYRVPNNVLMLGRAQVQDTTRNVFAVANRIFYEDSLKQVTLNDNAAVALRTEEKEKVDTIYIGADRLVYYTVRKCDIPEGELSASASRIEEIHSDPVTEYRRKAMKAAEETAKQAAEANAESNPLLAAKGGGKTPMKGKGPARGKKEAVDAEPPAVTPEPPAATPDTLAAVSDTLSVVSDQTGSSPQLDSLARARADSIHVADSLANLPPPDTTRIGFAMGVGNVKIFRQDIQVLCDSLRFTELDSIARFYIEPKVWNDGNRQYTADSLSVLVKSNGIDRASLMGNAFIITQETPVLFDQIRSTEVMAYFDSTAALRRFDAMGGANAIFFLKEKDEIATVNKVDCKMLSAWFQDGELRTVHYFESPKNDAYPLPQLREDERRMKGFNWQPELQPKGKEDITTLSVRASQRREYEAHPKTAFRQTEIYFPGYMKDVYAALEAAKNRPKHRKAEKADVDSTLALPDTSSVIAVDSLSTVRDISDSLSVKTDSLSVSADTLAVRDTIPPHVPTKKELREQAYQARVAAREARWAAADSLDAVKLAKKEAARQAKKEAREARAAEKQMKLAEEDAAKLQRYVERYARRKERAERRAARRGKNEQPTSDNDNGNDSGKIPEVRGDRHSEQRELGEPALDSKAVESAETPVQGTE